MGPTRSSRAAPSGADLEDVDTCVAPAVPPPSRPATTPRAEIQGLRALAVTLVVLYHLAPTRLPGGYVGAAAIADVAADPTVQDVLVGYRSDIYEHVTADGGLEDAFPADTIRSALQPLVDAGKRVHVVRAVPTTNGISPPDVLGDLGVPAPDCIAGSDQVYDPCAGPRTQRVVPDYFAEAVAGMAGVDVVDLTDLYCDQELCHQVIGGVVVYWDGSHITATFSRTLAPFLRRALERTP